MGRTVDFESIKGEQAASHSISASVRTSNKKMILLPRLTSIAIQC